MLRVAMLKYCRYAGLGLGLQDRGGEDRTVSFARDLRMSHTPF